MKYSVGRGKGSFFCSAPEKKVVKFAVCSLQTYNSVAAASFTLIEIVKSLFILIILNQYSIKKCSFWENVRKSKVFSYYKIDLPTNFFKKEYTDTLTNTN